MSRKFPVNIFLKSYNKESNEGYFLEVDFHYPEKWHKLHNDLPFLPERVKLEKCVANLHGKIEEVIHTINLKHALNHGLNLNKVLKVIKFNQQAWLTRIKCWYEYKAKIKRKK